MLYAERDVSVLNAKTKIILLILFVVLAVGCACFGFIIHLFNNTQIEMYSVTHVKLDVAESDIIDYYMFLNPSKGKTEVLKQINEDIRVEIADYMKNNDFKLKQGVYYIPKKSIINSEENILSCDEYIKQFKFEKIN